MPRPTKKTSEVITKIEQAAALDCSVEEMAFYANIHRDTLYLWLKEDKEFSDKINALRNRPVLKARQEVVKGLEDNAEFSLRYLERKRKAEFSTRQEQVIDDQRDDEHLDELKKINEALNGKSENKKGSSKDDRQDVLQR